MSLKRRRQIRCSLCTPFRWLGNHKRRFKQKEQAIRKENKKLVKEHGYNLINNE